MPWIGKEDLEELRIDLRNAELKSATLEVQLAAETSRRERVELEYARLNDDFRGLIALTAGRVPPRVAPEFDRDPFAEDESRAVTFLSPDPDEELVDAEAILRSIDAARSEEQPLSG